MVVDDDSKATPTTGSDVEPTERIELPKTGILGYFNYVADNTWRQDLHGISMTESSRAKQIWDTSEQYDPKAEDLFSYLQVFTACLVAFAHGANDVANAIAPVSSILQIYKDGKIVPKSTVYTWVLAIGGFGIGIGFALYGYKIIKVRNVYCFVPRIFTCVLTLRVAAHLFLERRSVLN